MSSKNKSIKINPYIVISLILLGIFLAVIFNKLVFAFSNVEKVLIENKNNVNTQKTFRADELQSLKTKMPLTQ